MIDSTRNCGNPPRSACYGLSRSGPYCYWSHSFGLQDRPCRSSAVRAKPAAPPPAAAMACGVDLCVTEESHPVTEMSNIVRPQEARWLVELTDKCTCARVCVCTRGYACTVWINRQNLNREKGSERDQ